MSADHLDVRALVVRTCAEQGVPVVPPAHILEAAAAVLALGSQEVPHVRAA